MSSPLNMLILLVLFLVDFNKEEASLCKAIDSETIYVDSSDFVYSDDSMNKIDVKYSKIGNLFTARIDWLRKQKFVFPKHRSLDREYFDVKNILYRVSERIINQETADSTKSTNQKDAP